MENEMLRVLHTSDWHLGKTLYGRRRHDEFKQFLDWLIDTISAYNIDVLLVSGDIFDTTLPGNRTQELYYKFLSRASTLCTHIVITGGNHDSPSFLDAPKMILKPLNITVIGEMSTAEDEVIVLRDSSGAAQMIVCAVPYLRDQDIRTVIAGETADDKRYNLVNGINAHYRKVYDLAKNKQAEHGGVPIIAMGHFFVTNSVTVAGDGVRELYVGTLADVGSDIFIDGIDYYALGHLHIPQRVGGADHVRYCGSPIAMGFGEAGQTKYVVLAEFGDERVISEIVVPVFQELLRISGDEDKLMAEVEYLRFAGSKAWIEVEYTGAQIDYQRVSQHLYDYVENSNMEITVISKSIKDNIMSADKNILQELDERDVFAQCLDMKGIAAEDREGLMETYIEVLRLIKEEDTNL